jgi:hypothetical protein
MAFRSRKKSTNGYFRLHIYLCTNKTSIHNSSYVFEKWGKILSHEKDILQLQYDNVNRKGQADPHNQRPDKWSSTVLRRRYGRNHERVRQQTGDVSIKTKFTICTVDQSYFHDKVI